ncbi:quinone oxidoreductase [Actinoplanes sp. LDG1-06]|uniref:Quinone oxidoreductase n=1 Tax=Paractinoplanes ovalisporus TaxID=2810368 RepID=A0ABS2AJW5_9ACTN|nr:quinone oxidoreductase [Actinoplanes ovalisporus]MBM2620101.1 quinone oxidoreductase [Actinoplanes ovalisporus]
MTARVVVLAEQGGPDVLGVRTHEIPEPPPGHVLVEMAAAGVNQVDLYQRSGAYRVELPFAPGFEGAGTVLRTGTGVVAVEAGDRVAFSGVPGAYASHCLVPAERLVPVPVGLSLEDAAAGLVQAMTADMLAHDVVDLGPSSRCLVLAAAGGVGGLLCQLAAARGATVIGAVGDPAKAPSVPAAHVVSYAGGHFADEVRALGPIDVVFDGIGAATAGEGLRCLRPRGAYVLYGRAGGPPEPVAPDQLRAAGSVTFTSVSLAHFDPDPAHMRRRAGRVLDLVCRGDLRIRVAAAFPLERAADAHRLVESRSAAGKVLLIP